MFLKILLIIIVVLIILYFLAIMPGMSKKAISHELLKQNLYAHRGLHDNKSAAPENSMAAFKKAVDGGYGIELDVQLTKDGVPVIFHDFTLARVARYEEGQIPADAVKNEDGSIKQVVPSHAGIAPVDVSELTEQLLTGIGGASLKYKEGKNKDGWVYDLQGRRVSHPQKGLYISAGRKIVIK